MTDEELIRKISHRDKEAFAQLVRRHQAKVQGICLNLIHDFPSAQDVAQEVFLEVYRSAKRFRFECRVSSWLYRIAVNRSLNLIRERRRSRWFQVLSLSEVPDSPAEEMWPAAGESIPDKRFESAELDDFLRKAVDSLPVKQRIPLILQKQEGFTASEIAEILRLTRTTVEARLRRAKSNLKKQILDFLPYF